MNLTYLSSDISIIWFWIGLFVLLGMAHSYRGSRRAIRKAMRLRDELDDALDARRTTMRRLFPEDAELARICQRAEESTDVEESFAVEGDLDRWLYRRQKDDRGAHAAASTNAAHLAAAMSNLRSIRDRYNESASVIASLRRSLPGAVIARALIDTDPPLLPDPDLT